MSSEDYLIRQFQQLAQVIARIIGLRENKKYNEALEDINQVFNTWFNTDIQALENNESEWETIFTRPSHHLQSEKIIAELLYQKAIICTKAEMFDNAKQIAKAALFFLKQIDQLSGEFSVENQHRIVTLSEITTSKTH